MPCGVCKGASLARTIKTSFASSPDELRTQGWAKSWKSQDYWILNDHQLLQILSNEHPSCPIPICLQYIYVSLLLWYLVISPPVLLANSTTSIRRSNPLSAKRLEPAAKCWMPNLTTTGCMVFPSPNPYLILSTFQALGMQLMTVQRLWRLWAYVWSMVVSNGRAWRSQRG